MKKRDDVFVDLLRELASLFALIPTAPHYLSHFFLLISEHELDGLSTLLVEVGRSL